MKLALAYAAGLASAFLFHRYRGWIMWHATALRRRAYARIGPQCDMCLKRVPPEEHGTKSKLLRAVFRALGITQALDGDNLCNICAITCAFVHDRSRRERNA